MFETKNDLLFKSLIFALFFEKNVYNLNISCKEKV